MRRCTAQSESTTRTTMLPPANTPTPYAASNCKRTPPPTHDPVMEAPAIAQTLSHSIMKIGGTSSPHMDAIPKLNGFSHTRNLQRRRESIIRDATNRTHVRRRWQERSLRGHGLGWLLTLPMELQMQKRLKPLHTLRRQSPEKWRFPETKTTSTPSASSQRHHQSLRTCRRESTWRHTFGQIRGQRSALDEIGSWGGPYQTWFDAETCESIITTAMYVMAANSKPASRASCVTKYLKRGTHY